MRRCVSLWVLLIASLLLGGCASSMKLSVKPATPPAPPPVVERTYASLWDAVEHGDLESAQKLEAAAGEKELVQAMQIAQQGQIDEAIAAARKVWLGSADSTTHARARGVLSSLLFTRSRWQDLLEVSTQDSALIKSEDDERALFRVFTAAPKTEFTLPSAPDTLPLYFNGVGLPAIDVTVNGHPKRFILDTGAAQTVLSSDFARECGVTASEASIEAGTSNQKTVPVQAAVLDSIRWGKLFITHHPAMVIETSHLRFRLLGLITLLRIDGILGWNAIRELDLTLNYPERYAVVRAPHKMESPARNLFDLGEPMVILTDEAGTPLNFLLDTGANVSGLYNRALERIKATDLQQRTSFVGGAGGMEKVKTSVVPKLTLYTGGFALQFEKMRADPDLKGEGILRDGVLASDVPHRGKIRIDFLNGRFEFEALEKTKH